MYGDLSDKYIQDDNGNYRLFDSEGNDLKAEAIKSWYDITQRLIKLLYELENNYGIDKEQRRRFHNAVDDFGWSEQKKNGEFLQKNLSPDSPYMILSYLYKVENTVNRKQLKETEEAMKKNCLVSSVPEDKESEYLNLTEMEIHLLTEVFSRLSDLEDPKRAFVDETSDVSKLYFENKNDSEQALKDIESIKVLSERLNDLREKLNNIKSISRYPESLQSWIENEIIYKAIQIGYTAGINANTTQILRRMRADNSSDNSKQG